VVPEVHDELLGLADIQNKRLLFLHHCVSWATSSLYLLSVLVVVAYQADNCGVICKFDDLVATMYG